jgi:hypothetical protein
MKNTPWFLASLFLLVIVSCNKEKSVDSLGNAGGDGTELGTWKFIGMHASTSQTVELKSTGFDDMTTVTLSDYNTYNNGGTIKFTNAAMVYTNLVYSVDTIAKAYMYTNGVLDDSLEFPFAFTLPATSGSAAYKKIGSDSLYLQSGAINVAGGTGTIQSVGNGNKLKFFGDTMTMTQTYDASQFDLVPGGSQRTTTHAVTVTVLKRSS